MPSDQMINTLAPNNQAGALGNSSPWEEDAPEPASTGKPAIIGSLDPKEKNAESENPAPFNVPEDVEEKVGKAVPAQNFIMPKASKDTKSEEGVSSLINTSPKTFIPSPPPPVKMPAPPAPQAVSKPLSPSSTPPPPIAGEMTPPQIPQEIKPEPLIQEPSKPMETEPTSADIFDFDESETSSYRPEPVAAPVPKPVSNSINYFQNKIEPQPMPEALPANSIFPENTYAEEQAPTTPEEKKSSFLSRILNKKEQSVVPEIAKAQPAAASFQERAKGGHSLFGRRMIIVFGVIIFFALITGLTELGLLSVGAEKIYGAIGIEKLWGGLSKNPESALLVMATKMQSHPDFKIKGTITMTVDSSINSPITSPLVSFAQNKFLASDQDMGKKIKAVKTAVTDESDVYDMYTQDSTDSSGSDTSTSSDGSSSGTDSLDTSSTSDSAISTDSSSTSDSSSGASSDTGLDSSSNSEEVSNVSEVKASISTKSSQDGLETNISLDNVSEQSAIDLLLKEGTLYVKSDTLKFSQNAETGKWLSFNIDQIKDKKIQSDIFDISNSSGLSVKGKRAGNEKVGGVRCYKYQIDSLEIGSALSSIGITSDMIQNISGNVWIGINDKLLRKASFKIVSPVSSSVSSMNVDLEFSDFDVENKIVYPDSSEVVAGSINNSIAAASETSSASSTSTSGESSTTAAPVASNNTTVSNDTKRKTDVNNMLTALKSYKTDNGSYPKSQNLLKLNSDNNIIKNALVPKYLSAWPSDPTVGWYYAYKSDGVKCSISARLENTSDAEGVVIGGVFLYLKYNNQ